MKELSLNILDIAENSVRGGAGNVKIEITESDTTLTIKITDDGHGIPPEILGTVTDPFTTTRTTRAVGMGLPLFKMAAEMTGGNLSVESTAETGTSVKAEFFTEHIDMPPLGSIWETLGALISGSPDIDFLYIHNTKRGKFKLDTKILRETLDGVSISEAEIVLWITEYIKENEKDL